MIDLHEWLADDAYFERIDERFEDLPHTLRYRDHLLSRVANRGSASAAARADGPPDRGQRLPGGPSALIFHSTLADCHPWEPAARWHDGQRICWPCTEHLLTQRDAPALGQEPGA